MGEELLAAEQARIDRAAAEAMAVAELRVAAPAIIDLLTAVVARLAALEYEVQQNRAGIDRAIGYMMATRIRKPIRNAAGEIIYVVDELAPPPDVAALTMET